MLKRRVERLKKVDGQALIEFLLFMPIILAFVWYTLHVSMAINRSIVGQKHARSQTFLRLMNSANGPQISPDLLSLPRSAYFIGVSRDVVSRERVEPWAPVVRLGVGFNPQTLPNTNDDDGEPEAGALRQNVRIRTAFGICTPRKRVKNSTALTDYCSDENRGN